MKKFLLSVVAGMSLTATTMAQTVPSYVPTNGLVGYWGFDGNAQDYSGNGNHGTVNGATLTADRNGVSNKAYSFDGVDDNILVNNSISLNMPSITISGWVNLHISPTGSAGQSGDVALVNKWYQQINCNNKNDSYNIEIARVNNSPTLLGATTLYSGTTFASNTSLSLDSWVYFTFVHNSSIGGKLYMNGNLVASNTLSGAICNSTNSLYFGADNNKGVLWRFLNGKLDDIGIWNRALTQQEITALYNSCNLNPTITPTAANSNAGNDASFQATSGGSNLNFQWQTNSNNLGWQNVPNNLNYSGANTASLTVKNVQLGNHLQPFRVIATSGSCSDTSDVADIQLSDTCLITVHDTLVINRTITGLSAPNNKNTIKVYPNPAKDHVIIHYGNFAMMNGYSVKITNTLGQELFASPINQQTSSVNLSNWINHSLYFVQIIDPQGKTVETRKILIE